MSNTNQKPAKKKHALAIVIAWTLVMALLAVGCYLGGKNYYDKSLEQAQADLQEQQAEAEATNAALQEEYAVALAQFEAETSSGANLAWPAQKTEGWDVVDLTSYPLENVSTTTMTRAETMNNGMLLVNEFHSRPDDFDDSAVVSLQTYTKKADLVIKCKDNTIKMFPVAIDALSECLKAAKELGYENYVPWVGYRTWDEQNTLFQEEMAKHASRYSGDALIARTKQSVNYPGTSEYNSGLSCLIRLYKSGDSTVNNKKFFESDEGIWLYENSWRYGLVFRFPLADYPVKGTADKSYKTGVSLQLQTFRYVGKGNAAVMHTLDLCLEEYIEYLMEHPHIAVFEDGQLKYEIYREYVGDADTFEVSLCGSSGVRSHTTSLDNMGYVITVFEY